MYETIIFNLKSLIVDKEPQYKEVNDLILSLYKEGYTLGVYTDEQELNTENLLRILKINEYISSIKYSNDCYTKVQLIKQILEECACSSAIIVGPDTDDVDAAYEVKAKYIGICYDKTFQNNSDIEFLINSPLEIYDTIKKIDKLSEASLPISLKYEGVSLIPVQTKHIQAINMMVMDEEAREMLGVTTFSDEAYYEDNSNKCYIITDECESFIGIVELFDISWKNRRGELSICISPSFRGKGFAYKAIKLLLSLGFGQMGLN
ncbi:GNAT family N-acetyltransferase [Clostridium manihotivorum]|nr:GNAT family N-acetyltransferase [Clostridium manihotivorum]